MAKTIVSDLLQIFRTSVNAVLPENLIRKSLAFNPNNQQLTVVGDKLHIKDKNVYVVGTGKAVQNMAKEIENILGSKIKQGIISVPEGSLSHTVGSHNVFYYEGAKNNLPDIKAETTAKKVRNLAMGLGEDDLLLVLISGGGSALLPLSIEPITLEDKTDLIKKLANSGADIKELNTVRKKFSGIKGGQLAVNAQPAQVISLILSDIVGDPLDLIASGPTTENEDPPTKAIDVIKKYNLYDELPESIKSILLKDNNTKTFPKENVKNHIIGSNKLSIAAAIGEARKLNYIPIKLSHTVTGNVKDISKEYVNLTKLICDYLIGKLDMDNLKAKVNTLNIPGIEANNLEILRNMKNKDVCLILGGEITVEVKGKGKGGRNQQLALEFSKLIHNLKDELELFTVYLLSAGTDGIDGPTDAAGAIGHLDLIAEAKKENLNIEHYLENNDSYNFYKRYKNGNLHVITGHTNTNVMDIHLIIIKSNLNKKSVL